jgi:hypothetical protein
MQQSASQEAQAVTASIGNAQEVKRQAGEASVVLTNISGMFESAASTPQEHRVALAFARDAGQFSSGYQAIAESRTDQEFANAVFGMCAPQRQQAAPRVGQLMLGFAGLLSSKPPPASAQLANLASAGFAGAQEAARTTEQQRQSAISYCRVFGNRLIDIPVKCQQAGSAMAEASSQEQQAEINHSQNVNAALTTAAVVFAGAVLFATAVGSAAATQPPVVQSNYYNNQFYGN